jgi:predicted dehydrogenase
MTLIPLAFVGGSINSAVGNTHRIASQMDGRFELVAGCFSRNSEMNSRTAHSWGVPQDRLYGDWQSLIDSESVRESVLVLLTPTPAHEEILFYALEKKMRVICEKSLTTTVESTQQLIRLLNDDISRLYAVYNYTGYPMVRELKNLIRAGALGQLLHCEVEMPQEGFLRRNRDGSIVQPQEWRRSDSFIPTVSLDLGIHVLNLLRFVADVHPERVVATYQSRGNIPDVIDHVSVLCECTDNVKADLRFGKTSLGKSNGLAITCYGSETSATWVQSDPEYLIMSDPYGETSKIHRGSLTCEVASHLRYNRFKAGHPSGFLEAFSNHYFDIAEDLSGEQHDDSYTFTAQDALMDMQVLHAISESVQLGHWTQVSPL